MEHIRTIDELINEKFEFKKWKYYIMGIGIYAAIAGYPKFRKAIGIKDRIDTQSIHNIINDIEGEPTSKQKILIDSLKNSMIDEAKSSNKLNDVDKEKVVNAINKIKVVMTSNRNINLISSKEGSVAFYMNYMDIDRTRKKVIMISEDRLKSNTLSITHEIYHLIDDILGTDTSNYSEIAEIINLLDKDIVMKNDAGIKKIENKLDFFIEQSLVQPRDTKSNTNNINNKNVQKPLTDEEAKKLKEKIIHSLRELIYDNKEYITSPSEIYVRFHGLKRWLLQENFIKDINEPITKKVIIDIFKNTKLLNNFENEKIDHFELLFMLNIDITNDIESEQDAQTLKKANSIVSNFSDYNRNNIV